MTGIYKITNKINGHCYIGQSKNIKERWIQHKSKYRKNNRVISKAFVKYGFENFKFEVLEECPADKLNERERHYIKLLEPEYNMNDGGKGNQGLRLTKEAKKTLSEKARQQWENYSEEERQRIITHNLKGPTKGKPRSEETKKILSRLSKDYCNANPKSEEDKKRVSEQMLEVWKTRDRTFKYQWKKVVQIDKETDKPLKVFNSINEAAKETNISACNISTACTGKEGKRLKRRLTAGGYKWKYLNECSVETIPQGSRTEDELLSQAQGGLNLSQ